MTILGGDGLNNVDATTHYAYTPVYAASFDQPRPWLSDPIIRDLKNEKFSRQYPAGSSSIWIPKDTLLAIDAVHVFTQTVQDLGQTNIAQQDFNTALQTVIVTDGESSQIVFHGNRSTHNHISDRDQETVYITCYDTDHKLNMMYEYNATIDDGTVLGIASPPSYVRYDTKHC